MALIFSRLGMKRFAFNCGGVIGRQAAVFKRVISRRFRRADVLDLTRRIDALITFI